MIIRQSSIILVLISVFSLPCFAQEVLMEVVQINHTTTNEVLNLLAKHPEFGAISADPASNKVSITGSKEIIAELKTAIAAIDTPRDQLEIKLVAVDTSKTKSDVRGFNFQLDRLAKVEQDSNGVKQVSFLDGQLGFTTIGNMKLIAEILASSDTDMLKILATPRVTLQDGLEASLFIGRKIFVPIYQAFGGTPVEIKPIEAGITLKVTARVIAPNQIMVSVLKGEISETIGTGPAGYPSINSRSVVNQQKVKDGETLVIAGLSSSSEYYFKSKVPILGEIPLIGKLFQFMRKAKEEHEVTFLLTPKIIRPETISPSVERAKVVEKERAPKATPGIEPSSNTGPAHNTEPKK